jgi:hypothetical protein
MAQTKITTKSLGLEEVQTSNIADNAVTSEKIATGAITLDKISDASLVETTPVGTVIWYANNVPPAGYLVADGSILNQSTYSALFAAIGTKWNKGDEPASHFRIPDLRGEFIRGWDAGKQIDNGRLFASNQSDAFQGHRHTVVALQQLLATPGLAGGSNYNFNYNYPTTYTIEPLDDYGFPRVAEETRPRNVALLPCIKYTQIQAISQTALNVQSLASTKLNITGGTLTGDLKLATGRTIRRIIIQSDTARYASTNWMIGPRFPTITGFKAGSLVRIFYHIPGRNDGGNWGGGYIEPQISYNDGISYVSLGSCGHDGGVMNYGGASNANSFDIGSYNNTLLIDPQLQTDFSVTIRFYIAPYNSTYVVNGDNAINNISGTAPLATGVNGNQHYSHVIVEELY